MKKDLKILFVSFHDSGYSRTGNLFSGLRALGYNCEFVQLSDNSLRSISRIRALAKTYRNSKNLIVGSGSQKIAIALRFFGARKFIFDSGWTLTESYLSNKNIISIWKFIKTFLLDFVSLKCSSTVLVESSPQQSYISKFFLVKKSKLIISYTGIDEYKFQRIVPIKPKEVEDDRKNYILFRGKRNKESGMENIARITREKLFENEHFVIATNKNLDDLKWGESVTLISRSISDAEMSWLYLNCKLTLGQLSKSPRLVNTIPHKIWEAIYFERSSVVIKDSAAHLLLGDSGSIPIKLNKRFECALQGLDFSQGTLVSKNEFIRDEIKPMITQTTIAENFLNQVILI